MGTLFMAQFMGALYGLLSVIFGAFGAHALKKRLTPELLQSFETGVKYQMYHAIVLLVLGFNLSFDQPLDSWIVNCFIFGTLLFSFSIYALCLGAAKGNKPKFLGPVTPLGGLLLTAGWALLLYSFVSNLV
ncbi:MAG TPA: DUF423 domain-containing protein [Muricauda sp.]|uniref:DUF423 domain-containing protein n=1 Tax=Flagellimonas aurea TaxID=2915619 RepID=A0ABS3G0X1_9FLAO|nr:DUF423 domain-containing protein [Allomuricauda aurea]MAO18835.1 hypothetical protein [Allomuricauda sp.]MBC73360.1 hypothetical protein [Allomuricauda sp.]MBO0353025.1 DUF423 domain-containing protein [Allomuricauda aurea]HBU77038.1 DUF423 domain-containing protein [Allomuricauda sp.]|tara:strand:+ start:792 stop:1184 length:393 start_codon:yes stop_codon:yes gene_type:complete